MNLAYSLQNFSISGVTCHPDRHTRDNSVIAPSDAKSFRKPVRLASGRSCRFSMQCSIRAISSAGL